MIDWTLFYEESLHKEQRKKPKELSNLENFYNCK